MFFFSPHSSLIHLLTHPHHVSCLLSPVSCLLPLAASHTTIVKSNDTTSTSRLAFFLTSTMTMSYENYENYDNMFFFLLLVLLLPLLLLLLVLGCNCNLQLFFAFFLPELLLLLCFCQFAFLFAAACLLVCSSCCLMLLPLLQ